MCSQNNSATLESLYLRIAPGEFHYLKFIIEAYDNLAILSSVDSKEGIVVLRYSGGHRQELFSLLSNIAGRLAG